MLRAYLAAPFLDAPQVRALDAELRNFGIACTSRWAHEADGPEALDRLSIEEVRKIALSNDRDLLSAQILIAFARDGAGAEMFAEVRLALSHRIPVVWVGSRRPLSAYREGVMRVDSVEEAKIYALGFAEMVRALPAFEKRRAREVLWDVIEGVDAVEAAPPKRAHLRLV